MQPQNNQLIIVDCPSVSPATGWQPVQGVLCRDLGWMEHVDI